MINRAKLRYLMVIVVNHWFWWIVTVRPLCVMLLSLNMPYSVTSLASTISCCVALLALTDPCCFDVPASTVP